ncbi:2Fe-2S iron-sulfur cluster-binding protein [uncultured Psychrosphaera sp.]|uniref:2Fe-2S iron-sulfur cluster-binding protein n=1 Tax=uncultured Psychrosphaera sp. TaxID=1403522 RepID=UPI00261F2141|nr:2Fe-2S iron-sulfur cluster-binding protein [uncultured Psychrosphaera sp.]
MTKITIKPSGIEFEVNEGETILEAAERSKIGFPYRCRQGVCTSCVCKTIDGEVSYGDRDEATLLTQADDGQKYTYACIGYPKTDMTLHHPFIK